MNQSILFPDLQHWDNERQRVHFPVQVQGATLDCYIGIQALAKLAECECLSDSQVLQVFEEYRFDIEDWVETLIEQEAFDEHGAIQLQP
ncbi:DUF1488 domain-containing protein [Shewanella salipaludis]|uniref:DUF1488 domain-containing protein n=1 Tax=Shewanella salipaludis TaxID=2723052 RepID=A0A972JMQ7_9GAMM|nr:DUF1488 domain-containing protein [Shewanella salipaludis]NMH66757.1 DUF1488 domain-containing protein [Shewanella salipaludis]